MPKQNTKVEELPKGNKALKIVVFVLLLAFYASFQLVPIDIPAADDLPRMIQNGEDVLAGNYSVLTKNVYSYTEPDQPFANHHWFSGILYYLVHGAVGFSGLTIFKTVVLLAAFSILFAAALQKADFWLVAAFAIPVILMISGRTRVRPEIFSYLFIAIYLYLLLDSAEHPERKRIFWLIPLQLLWVNLHLYFGIGILMVAGFIVEQYYQQKINPTPVRRSLIKKLAILALILILVSLINPFGFRGALFALSVNIGKDFPVGIAETRSFSAFLAESSLWADLTVALFVPLLVILAISFLFNLGHRSTFYFLACAGTAFLTFKVMRALPLFAFMFLPAVSANFDSAWQKVKPKIYKFAPAALILVLAYLVIFDIGTFRAKAEGWGVGPAKNAELAAEFISEHNIRGPIFNDPDAGSFLIYYLYPRERVFSDNRFGDAYSAEFFQKALIDGVSTNEKWAELDSQYGFNALILYQYDQGEKFRDFLYARVADPSYALVYGDNYIVIFLKHNEQNQEIINDFAITSDTAEERFRFLSESSNPDEKMSGADLLKLAGRSDLALPVYEQVVAEKPENYPAWVALAELQIFYFEEPDRGLVIEYLNRAIEEGDYSARTHALLGFVYVQIDDKDNAEKYLRRALEIDSTTPNAKELLKEIGRE